jgi:hypothetical protein
MNAKEYREYQESVHDFFDKEGITHLSIQSEDDYEPSFSSESCDCCGTYLGGDRYTCNSYNPKTKEVQSDYSICPNCYYFAEYGKLNDQTMMNIEASEKALEQYKAHPYAWPGGYQVNAIMADGEWMCHGCICNEVEVFQDDNAMPNDGHDPAWRFIGAEVYWEGPMVQCAHCGCDITSEYGDPDADA